jgi:hypothetical protein
MYQVHSQIVIADKLASVILSAIIEQYQLYIRQSIGYLVSCMYQLTYQTYGN